ncbi:MAG: DUF3108 domain-containing protein [Gammaproteobacteria bacterium]|tara:strand:+ start:41 stop:733 length:693 start_codon:yes stop_codon:yes gene_type:complete
MRKLKLLIILLLSSISISAVEAIRPSKAILESNVGEMEVQMNLLDDGSWKLTSLLDGGSIVKREESEVFELIDNQIKPINYRFNQRILFRKYIASADFDWTDKTVSYVENKDSGTLGLDENILGPSSASLQLRLDFRKLTEENIPNEITYKVYWKGTIKERTYDVNKDKESVETPLGIFEAYKVSRKFSKDSNRSQIFWLAPGLDFSVIKIYDKNDREVEIKIKEFEELG